MRFRLFVVMTLVVALRSAAGTLEENVAARSDATQTYTLYLPSGYDSSQKHPLLYVFDPRGRGTTAAGIFRDAAEQYGWIVISSNQTRSDDDGAANRRAIRALLPEADRYGVDRGRLYAAGFSGTAILADMVALKTNMFAGVIAVGGRIVDEAPPSQFRFARYGFAGDSDFNNREMRALEDLLPRDVPHRFERFAAAHAWITSELAAKALGWMELEAMKAQRRPRDASLVDRLYRDEVAAAAALELNGRHREALRQYEAIVTTFDGLRETTDARAASARLSADAVVQRELADEAKWDLYEERFTSDVFARMPAHLAAIVAANNDAVREFRVPELERHARAGGFEALAGKRLLEAVHVQTAVYLPEQLEARGKYALAATLLGVAVRIHPERDNTWYRLGAAWARAGDRRQSLRALRKAVELGFDDVARLSADESYASLREDRQFRAIVSAMRK